MSPIDGIQDYRAIDERGPTRAGEISLEFRGVKPVPEDGRYGSPGRLFTMWVKMSPAMFFVGALAGAPFIGLGFVPALCAVLIGNVLGGVLTGSFAVLGCRTGVPQLQESRLAFRGTVVLPSTLQWATQIGFEALTLLFAAEALVVLFNIPFVAGAIIALVCMGVISLLGYEVVHSVQKGVTVAFAILFAIITASIISKNPTVVQTTHGGAAVGSFFLLLAAALGIALFCTTASDYSRYLPADTPTYKVVLPVAGGMIISMTWIESLGIVASPLLRGSSTMRSVFLITGGGALGEVTMAGMALGAISIMVLTDYSGALAAQAAGINIIRPLITVLSAFVAFGVALWLHSGDVSSKFQDVLLLITYWVTPWAAIVAVNWIWQGRRMTRQSLLELWASPLRSLKEGREATMAVIALVVGFIVALPFSNTGLDTTISKSVPALSWLFGGFSRHYLHGADLDFYVGFVVAGIIYLSSLLLRGPRNIKKQHINKKQHRNS